MSNKGREFKGFFGGDGYDRLASVMGMGEVYYEKAIGDLNFQKNTRILEIGCGTGSLSMALSKKVDVSSELHCIDISEDQLKKAREKSADSDVPFIFKNHSMDELPYPDDSFDAVITSMALHETPSDIRRAAIRETARVLKKNGKFLFVDWSKPRFGLLGIIWFPTLFFGEWKDNWNNTYCSLCEKEGLVLKEDYYINSISRRQLFIKE